MQPPPRLTQRIGQPRQAKFLGAEVDVRSAAASADGDARRMFAEDQRRLPTIAADFIMEQPLQAHQRIEGDAAEQVNLQGGLICTGCESSAAMLIPLDSKKSLNPALAPNR